MKLVVVATHPIQYQVPWYRRLAESEGMDLTVLYGLLPDPEQQGVGFGVPFTWDIPLLDGYRWEVLENAAPQPGLEGFRASNTPGVGRRLRSLSPDAVIITGWHQWPMLQALWAAVRLDVPRLVRGESNNLRKRPWHVRFLHRRLLARYDAFLAIGSANRDFYLDSGVADEQIFHVPYFVENERFAQQAARERPRREELRKGWGIPRDAVCFLFAGKLEQKKRPLDLLEALARMEHHRFPVHLLIVGAGPLMDEAQALVSEKDLPVTFTGFLNQTEITSAYVAADCMVLPSDNGETWGLVVNEAMACGLPAVVSDEVGCARDLIDRGRTGEIFPCRDRDALARVLTRLAHDPSGLEQMGRKARQHVSSFSVDAAVEGTLSAVRHVRKARRNRSHAFLR